MKVIAAGLTVVVLALGAGIASAATTEHPTEFTKFKATPGYAGVKGQIDSPEGECLKNRKITIFKKSNNEKGESGKTNSKGKFEFAWSGKFAGKYYAKVKEKNLDGDEVCQGAESKTIKV